MTTAADYRVRWNDGHLEALAGFAENRDRAREAMRAALYGARRETASRLALDLMSAEASRAGRETTLPRGLFPELAALFCSDPWKRADAMSRIDALDRWSGPLTVGSVFLAETGPTIAKGTALVGIADGTLAARAASVAAREEAEDLTVVRAWEETWPRLGADGGAMPRLANLLSVLERGFARNLRLAGRDDDAARAFATVAGRIVRGKMEVRDGGLERLPPAAYALGAAALAFGGRSRAASLVEGSLHDTIASFEHVRIRIFRDDVIRQARAEALMAGLGEHRHVARLLAKAGSGLYRASPALQADIDRLRDEREGRREKARQRFARLLVRLRFSRKMAGAFEQAGRLGAAGIGAAFGFVSGRDDAESSTDAPRDIEAVRGHDDPSEETVRFLIDGVEPLELTRAQVNALVHLSVDDAHSRLRLLAADHRLDEACRDASARLAEALQGFLRHAVMHRRSFGTALGFPASRTPHGHLADRARVWRAVPHGWPSLVRLSLKEKKRRLDVRPFADASGRLVGYAACDPLSLELHGASRYALYDLSGARVGRLEADEGGFRTILREPRGGFVTAPERIEI